MAALHLPFAGRIGKLFAALMGTFLLGETMGWRRVVAAAIIVAGLLLMNLPL